MAYDPLSAATMYGGSTSVVQPKATAPTTTDQYGANGTQWGSGANPYLETLANQYLGAYAQPTVTSQLTPYLTDQLTQQGQGSTYYNQTSGYYQQPTATSQQYATAQAGYNSPTALSSLSLDAYGRPMASESLGAQAQAMLGGPSSSAGNYAWAQGQVQGPTELQQQGARLDAGYEGANYLQQAAPQLEAGYNGANLLSNYAAVQAQALNDPGALEQHVGGIANQFNNAEFLQEASPEILAQIRAANGLTGYVGTQAASLQGPGLYEQFAKQSLEGSNPYYEMMSKEGRAKIDQEAIARGVYGAGGTLASLGNYQAHLDAEQYNNLSQQLLGAQQIGQARQQLGGQLFGASDATGLARAQALQGLATGKSTEMQNQARGLQGLYGDVQTLGQQRIGLGANIAGAADASTLARNQALQGLATGQTAEQLARTSALQNLYDQQFNERMNAVQVGTGAASAADAAAVARMAGITGATTAGDQVALARLAGQTSLASAQDQSRLSYLNSGMTAAGMVDTQGLNRITAGQSAAGGVDAYNLAQLGALSNVGTNADSMNLNYLNSMFNVGGAAQGAANTRINGMLGNELAVDSLQSGLVGGFYSQGGNLAGQAATSGISAQQNAALLAAQGQQANTTNWNDLLKSFLSMPSSTSGSTGTMQPNGLIQPAWY